MGSTPEDIPTLPFHSRPPLTSQHSNSVPSTPHQHARDFTSRSRSPSPNDDLGSHSPRSVSSEANGILPTLRKGRVGGCRFETNAAFGRRRMGYSSDQMLEKPTKEPKAVLDEHEDQKLSGDMRELYDRILPSEESENRRRLLVKKLETILRDEWPGNEFQVHVFGSSGNLLCTNESDVDICIQTPMRRLETMHMLAEALERHGMANVVCVASAKVPIVKIWDPELKLACDMNVNNTLALENTRMIRTYVQIDPRVRPLVMIIKHWTKRRILNDAALGGTLSSYTWICMALNFLQTREPPILPTLHQMPHRRESTTSGTQSDFADDLEQLKGFGDPNKETLGQLLFDFFRRYGHEIDYMLSVLSVRQGKLLTREEKHWEYNSSQNKEGRCRLCVEEPINTSRNLANSADDFSFRGIHEEIRLAFDLLADGQKLDECCKQYEYPVHERKEPMFKRPAPAPRPILAQSPSQAARASRTANGANGGKGPKDKKGAAGYRRASSSAAYGPRMPIPSPSMEMQNQNYFGRGTLHEQLQHQYQLIQKQQHQLLMQNADIMARAQQEQEFRIAQQQQGRSPHPPILPYDYLQKLALMSGQPSPRAMEGMPNSAPPLPQHFYPYQAYDSPPSMSQSTMQEGIRTNPSSPSLANRVPALRRDSQRSSVSTGPYSASIRSQSQPARGVPSSGVVQGVPQSLPPIPPVPSHLTMPPPLQARQSPVVSGNVTSQARPVYSMGPANGVPEEYAAPKEYLGYYLGESPQIRPQQFSDFAVPPIPSFQELTQRRRRISPDLRQQLMQVPSARASRSPSPLGHSRSHSMGPGALPMHDVIAGRQHERLVSRTPPEDNGLLIVNGSQPSNALSSRINGDMSSSISSNFSVDDEIDLPEESGFPAYHDPLSMPDARLYNSLPAQEAQASPDRSYVNGMHEISTATNLQHPPIVSSSAKRPSAHEYTSSMQPAVNSVKRDAKEENRSSNTSSPTHQQQFQPRPNAQTNGIPALDLSKSGFEGSQESRTGGTLLLSPVYESRSPSPTANRRKASEHISYANGSHTMSNGTESSSTQLFRQVNQQPQQTSAQKPMKSDPGSLADKQQHSPNISSPTAGSSQGGSANNNQGANWQKTGKKKRNNRKSNVSNKMNGEKAHTNGEPLPANEAERKGG